jgi:hypothetical protein
MSKFSKFQCLVSLNLQCQFTDPYSIYSRIIREISNVFCKLFVNSTYTLVNNYKLISIISILSNISELYNYEQKF